VWQLEKTHMYGSLKLCLSLSLTLAYTVNSLTFTFTGSSTCTACFTGAYSSAQGLRTRREEKLERDSEGGERGWILSGWKRQRLWETQEERTRKS